MIVPELRTDIAGGGACAQPRLDGPPPPKIQLDSGRGVALIR
jgi:hypothetical protein